MGTVWVSYGWTRKKPLENQGVSGAGPVFLNRLDVVPCTDGINRESVTAVMQTMML